MLLWVVHQLNRDVTVIGSLRLKLFSFVLDVFESGHLTSYWGKFGPLDPLDVSDTRGGIYQSDVYLWEL